MAHPHAEAPRASVRKQNSLVGGSAKTQSKDNPYAKDKKNGGKKKKRKKTPHRQLEKIHRSQ